MSSRARTAASRIAGAPPPGGSLDAVRVFRASALERVQMVRDGVPAELVNTMVTRTGIPKARLYRSLDFPRSTIEKKIKRGESLSPAESERIVGLERLLGQVEVMLQESGAADDVDASRWLGEWLQRPVPALGGAAPETLLDTVEGQRLVAQILAQAQSGAYG